MVSWLSVPFWISLCSCVQYCFSFWLQFLINKFICQLIFFDLLVCIYWLGCCEHQVWILNKLPQKYLNCTFFYLWSTFYLNVFHMLAVFFFRKNIRTEECCGVTGQPAPYYIFSSTWRAAASQSNTLTLHYHSDVDNMTHHFLLLLQSNYYWYWTEK